MSYSKYYNPTNWENYPSEDTAVNAMHLNNLEDGVDTLDDRIVALSTDKSEVSWNQTLISGEKIAEITVNGITKDVYAPEISDSVVEQAAEQALKSEGYAVGTQGDVPVTSGLYYHNNSKYYSEQASDSASDASASAVEAGQSADGAEEEALVSEGWANGEQNGVPVEEGSPYYHNNSKFYRDEASALADAFTSKAVETETGTFKSLTGGKLESCVVNFVPVQSGSGDPSPSNVRPITGHSSIDIDFYGKNFYDGSDVVKTESDPYVEVTLTHPIPSGGIYYLSAIAENELTTISQLLIEGYDSNGVRRASTSLPNGRGGRTSCPFMPFGSDVVKLRFFGSGYSTTTTNEVTFKDICIEKNGYQDYVYEPFVSKSENYGLGGTYYNGQVNLATGELTVDKAYAEFDGSNDENWGSALGTGYHQYGISINDAKNSTTAITNRFSLIELSDRGNKTGLVSIENDTIFRFALKDSDLLISDVNAWKTWLSSNPIQVCYELATPQTIQLTPQQIDTLVGMNNIVIPDAGQSLDSVIYRGVFAWDDVEDVVEKLDEKKADISAIGTDESGNATASKSYSQGDYFYKNGIAKAKTSIAQGATFTLNTNYEIKTLAEILQAIESAL